MPPEFYNFERLAGSAPRLGVRGSDIEEAARAAPFEGLIFGQLCRIAKLLEDFDKRGTSRREASRRCQRRHAKEARAWWYSLRLKRGAPPKALIEFLEIEMVGESDSDGADLWEFVPENFEGYIKTWADNPDELLRQWREWVGAAEP